MHKYYVIKNMETGAYLKAMTNDEWVGIKECGKWPSEESAVSWIDNIEEKYLEIIPIYKRFKT